ncbi:HDOD domain-containing protein [Marinobacterium litorale]|jgi:HD-like signal output (HDOD) protein|uniref:HDOD domain-containing protein n=1 Tax=Marinobacterium litorale TaxID=404770 RepID=UPI000424DE79|nr:HDOD domain-containing protein [Marinobacterium litorale]
MVWLWKKREKKTPLSNQANAGMSGKGESGLSVSGGASGGGSEALRVELYRIADVVPVQVGDDVTERVRASPEALFVPEEAVLELRFADGQPDEAVVLDDTFSLGRSVQSMSGFAIVAVKGGKLLRVDSAQLSALSDSLSQFLLKRLSVGEGRVLSAVLAAQSRVLGHRQRLAEQFYSLSVKSHSDLAQSQLVQKVIAKVPKLPVSTGELLSKLLDETSSRSEIAELVRQDPVLTSLLLKAINSSQYSFEQKIADVNRAVTLIGFDGVYQVIMAEGLRKSLPDTPVFRHSYQKAVELSHIAFALAQITGRVAPAEMSTVALLHDLGRVVAGLLSEQSPALVPFVGLLPPAVLGGQLLKSWSLPEQIWSAVAAQDYPEFAEPDRLEPLIRDRVAILYLSELIYEQQVVRQEVGEAVYLRSYLRAVGLGNKSLDLIWETELVPVMRKRLTALPAGLKQLIEAQKSA